MDFDSPIIVSCYHGVSSRNVATFLVEQGYENVFSVIGGFDGWVESRFTDRNGLLVFFDLKCGEIYRTFHFLSRYCLSTIAFNIV